VKRSGKAWTSEDLLKLRQMHRHGESDEAISEATGHPVGGVKTKRRHLGLTPGRSYARDSEVKRSDAR